MRKRRGLPNIFAAMRWFGLICALAAPAAPSASAQTGAIQIASKSFSSNGAIPDEFSCRGANISPELHWRGVSSSARALALIVEDPDAPGGSFTHWIVYNLPASINHLDENESKSMPEGALAGTNDFDHQGYDGPCPPPGRAHHYHFKLTALDATLDLPDGTRGAELNAAVAKHTIASGEIVGTFQR
jgi:Raf kinase inhibitor-like YbhB/YbcL family protein